MPMPVPEPVEAGWEQRLGARAFLWVGAITLALAAVFLVRYSIEEGYLSPEVRVILAALFGFALIGGAEKMRARDERVAQALAAAGVASLYGALFAAVALYDMISKVAAGGGAAALTAFAIGLSLRHGILVASLAFVGGFVESGHHRQRPAQHAGAVRLSPGDRRRHARRHSPSAAGGRSAGACWRARRSGRCFGCCRRRAACIGSACSWWRWPACSCGRPGGAWARARTRRPTSRPSSGRPSGSPGVLLVALIVQDGGRQSAGWLALAAHGAGLYVLGRWTPRFQYVAVLAPLLSIAALALWWGTTFGNLMGWDADRFAWIAILLGGFYAAGAFALLWNAARPGFWAALSVAAALAHFLLCWYVLRSAATGTPWGLISIGLAAPFLVGAERLARWRETMTGATEALGFLAAGVVFFIAAAIPLELRPRMDHRRLRHRIRRGRRHRRPARSSGDAQALLAAARRRGRALRAQSRDPEISAGRHADLQLAAVGLRPLDRGLPGRPAFPAADGRRTAGARNRGCRGAARLRAGDPARCAASSSPARWRRPTRASWSGRSMCWCGAPSPLRPFGWRAPAAIPWRCGRGG